MDVNRVTLSGEITDGPVFSHELYGDAFYTAFISVPRLSGTVDILPLMLPRRLANEVTQGVSICVDGQLRAYRRTGASGIRLQLLAYAQSLSPPRDEGTNQAELVGCLLRAPVVRKTPLGREIADLLLSTQRSHGKWDCVPCIAWGKHAHICGGLYPGQRMRLMGRMQARTYQKRLPDGDVEERITYEVSVGSIYEQ